MTTMDSLEIRTPLWLRVFAWFAVVWAFVLIWWGAAVTTEDVGLAVPDWPLSFGQVNPDGWWHSWALRLEHGHRYAASGLGMVVVFLFGFHWFRLDVLRGRGGKAIAELLGVLLFLALNVYGVQRLTHFLQEQRGFEGQGLFEEAGQLVPDVTIWSVWTAVTWSVVVAWLLWSWSKRGWSRMVKLGSLALILVVVQAELGGLRVVLISDIYAIIHGVLGQAFFCLLLLIAILSAPSTMMLKDRALGGLRSMSSVLVGSVFIQLVFGATVRHTQRITLEATDILTTGGSWLPDFGNTGLVMIFLHKLGALVAFSLAITLGLKARGVAAAGSGGLGAHVSWLFGLFAGQIVLGVSVLYFHGDQQAAFWITQLHVVNGLGILAVSGALAIRLWRAAGATASI